VTQPPLLEALDAALTLVRRLDAGGLRTASGEPAGPMLARLAEELAAQRAHALAGGEPEAGWPGRTVRWVSEWVPDDALPLLARLGAVARAVGRP
jgi:hypothetical protein